MIEVILYRVTHSHPDPVYDEVEEWYHIGIYSERGLAEDAVARLKKQPGFERYPDGFSIGETPVDVTHWEEGFTT
jgi:hypothetical protein